MGKETDGKSYKPGEVVPDSGIYKVHHDQHRLMHEAALLRDTFFPRCKRCGNAVRFVLARRVHSKSVLPFRSTDLLEESREERRRFRVS